MKIRRILTISFLSLLIGHNTSLAGERTEREMLSIAQKQLAKGNMRRSAAIIEKLKEERFYSIYGSSQQGFVIISRDDSFEPVLGYSDTKFDTTNIPCGMQWWLNAISERMATAEPMATRRAGTSVQPVEPLCKTTWGQRDPFNFLTPLINGSHAPTGCVATAMAQIMKYFNYPAQGMGKGFYTLSSSPTIRINENINTEYEWDKMKLAYNQYSLSDEERLPVARLMKDAGLATNMEYGAASSGAFSVIAARGFAYNFGYDSLALHCYYRQFFNDEMWMKTIYSELDAGRPILYTGSGEGGGHAFVFEGCDADGKIYVNWGWDGECNGYYDIANLTPVNEKGKSTMGHYNYEQSMAFGFKCQKQPDDDEVYKSLWGIDGTYELSVTGKIMFLKVPNVYNYHFLWFNGALGVYFHNMDGDSSKNMFFNVKNSQSTIATFFGFSNLDNSFFVNKVQAGKYRVYLASKAQNESVCQPVRCTGGAPYYDATIADGKVTFSEKKIFTTEEEPSAVKSIIRNNSQAPVRYYDLQGREVSRDTRGILIRKQGNEIRKVMSK